MLTLIRKLISNRLLHQSGFLTFGTIVNSFLGLAFYVLVARSLSVSSFGYFSFILAVAILAADLGDWGIDPSIIKFGGKNLSPILSLGILQRAIVGAILISVAIVAGFVFSVNFLPAAFVAISLLSLYLITQSFLAKQKYSLYVLTNIFGNSLRLLLVIATASSLTSSTSLMVFVFANLAAIMVGTVLFKKTFPEVKLSFSNIKNTFREVKVFSGWSGASFILSALSAKIDNLLVFSLAGPFQAGLYASAQKISTIFPQVASSLDSVFAPKLAASKAHFKNYFVLALLAAIAILGLIPFASIILSLLGDKYHQATSSFQILLVGMAGFILTGPFSSKVLYYHGRAKAYFINGVLQLSVAVVSYLVLVPRLGALGAASVFVISSFVSLGYFVSLHLFFTKND